MVALPAARLRLLPSLFLSRYVSMLQLQWPYDEWLARAAGPDIEQLPAWRPAMYSANRLNKLSHPEDYRDR